MKKKRILIIILICIAPFLPSCNDTYTKSEFKDMIEKQSDLIFEEMVQIRRDIHKNPELANNEKRTSSIIADLLKQYGLEVKTNVGGYGVVGVLKGYKETPIIAFRADMDALDMDLEENADFRSLNKGISHACGHDVHSTIGLGIARVLSTMKEHIPGTIIFIFQPAEEIIEGAKRMIADGVFENQLPEAIFANHVIPIETGLFVTNPGVGLPGIEEFEITISGTEGFIEKGNKIKENIVELRNVNYPDDLSGWQKHFEYWFEENSILSDFILSQAWTERTTDTSISINGFVKASSKENYIKVKELITKKISQYEREGYICEYNSNKILEDMFCHLNLGNWAVKPATEILNDSSIIVAPNSFPFFGEDFAYFIEEVPGVMFFLGASNSEKDISAFPHNSFFQVDEEVIKIGINSLSYILVSYLIDSPNISYKSYPYTK